MQGDALLERGQPGLVAEHGLGQRRGDEPGDDAVDADVLAGEVIGHDAHEPMCAGLAGAVGRLVVAEAQLPAGRARDRDRTTTGREQGPRTVLAGEEHARQVDVDGLLPDRQVEPVDAVVADAHELDAGHADDGVQAPERVRCLRHRSLDLGLAGDIAGRHEGPSTGCLDECRGLLQRLDASADQRHGRAFVSEAHRHGAPDAGPGACHQGPLALQSAVLLCHARLSPPAPGDGASWWTPGWTGSDRSDERSARRATAHHRRR